MKLYEMIYKIVVAFGPKERPVAGLLALSILVIFAIALAAIAGQGVGAVAHGVGQLDVPRILSARWLNPSTMVFAKLS